MGNLAVLAMALRSPRGRATRSPKGEAWWAFLDTYRTLCVVPTPEIREVFEHIRNGRAPALIDA
jgi:hypothetical protein